MDWFTCDCNNIHEVRFIKSNGAVCVRLQCMDCGVNVKDIKKFGIDVWSLPAWDEELRQRRYAERRETFYIERQRAKEAWWTRYNEYLRSDKWAELRRQVFRRDRYTCFECGEVFLDGGLHGHHISYRGYNDTGHSSIDEVLTLCRECHQKMHGFDESAIYAGVMAA